MSESVLVVDIGGVCGAVLQHEQCHDIEAPAHHPPTPTQPATISVCVCKQVTHHCRTKGWKLNSPMSESR